MKKQLVTLMCNPIILMFGTKGVERNDGYVYLSDGIHLVKVKSIEGVAPTEVNEKSGKVPAQHIKVVLEDKNGFSHVKKFYMSDAAREYAMQDLAHLFETMITSEELDKISGKDVVDYGSNLAKKLVGKSTRIHLVNKISNLNGKLQTEFSNKPFAEKAKLAEGEVSKLKHNPDKDNDQPGQATASAKTGSRKPAATEEEDYNWAESED